MKINVILISFISFLFFSCNLILKKEKESLKNTTIENDAILEVKDEKGCDYHAGYHWSVLRNNCIRVFEEGFRLNPVSLEDGDPEENELENNNVSCFVIFNSGKTQSEIFVPNMHDSKLLEQDKIKGIYVNDEGWKLDCRNDMELFYHDTIKFKAAKTIELKVIGTDETYNGLPE